MGGPRIGRRHVSERETLLRIPAANRGGHVTPRRATPTTAPAGRQRGSEQVRRFDAAQRRPASARVALERRVHAEIGAAERRDEKRSGTLGSARFSASACDRVADIGVSPNPTPRGGHLPSPIDRAPWTDDDGALIDFAPPAVAHAHGQLGVRRHQHAPTACRRAARPSHERHRPACRRRDR